MIIISSKIRLDAMSKVISFSISDKYLEKLRTLYPELTDNLAVKQFVTDRLDEGLSNSLDASLDDRLDGKLETMIQTRLDGLLDERLDATVGKLIGDLSERLARIETRLDESLDGSLDDMEPLLKLQREASIASPLPTGEPSPLPPSPPDRPAIEPTTLPPDDQNAIESDPANPPVTEAIEPAIEPAIETAIGDEPAIEDAIKVKPGRGFSNSELSEKINISKSTIEKWKARIQRGEKFEPKVYPNFFDHWILDADNLWYEIN